MAYNSRLYIDWDGSGGGQYRLPFPFISKDHVKATLSGNPFTAFSFVSDTEVCVDGIQQKGELCFYRETPTAPLVKWADGTILQAANLNIVLTQTQYILEEAQDKTIAEIVKTDKSVALTALEQIKAEYTKSINEIQGLKERVASELHAVKQEITDKIDPKINQMRSLNAVIQSNIPQLVEYNKTFRKLMNEIPPLLDKIAQGKTDVQALLKELNDWHDQVFGALGQLADSIKGECEQEVQRAKTDIEKAATSATSVINNTTQFALKQIKEAGAISSVEDIVVLSPLPLTLTRLKGADNSSVLNGISLDEKYKNYTCVPIINYVQYIIPPVTFFKIDGQNIGKVIQAGDITITPYVEIEYNPTGQKIMIDARTFVTINKNNVLTIPSVNSVVCDADIKFTVYYTVLLIKKKNDNVKE